MIHQNTKEKSTRGLERRGLLLITAILLSLFGVLYINLQPELYNAEIGYRNGTIINLAPGLDGKKLSALLMKGNYYTDIKDADFVSDHICKTLDQSGSIQNLGALNRADMMFDPATVNYSNAGRDVNTRVLQSYLALGIDSAFRALDIAKLKSETNIGEGSGSINASVDSGNKKKLANVIVKLQRHFRPVTSKTRIQPDTVFKNDHEIAVFTGKQLTAYWCFGITNENGEVVFKGLDQGGSYSLIPIKKGFEFGEPKGVVSLSNNKNLKPFFAKPHKVKLLGTYTYSQLKEDKALTVRTPADFRASLLLYTLMFVVIFWIVHFVWTMRDYQGDNLILPVLMLLSGISILLMFAIQDPLRDFIHGKDMAQGVLIGMTLFLIFSLFDFIKFYLSPKFDPISQLFQRRGLNTQTGYIYIVIAFGLLIALLLMGKGPEGSGVKVNLSLFGINFQPSEITKYLVVVLFAGYFTRNAQYLREIPSLKWRIRNSFAVFVIFGVLLGGYLLLGDMGPALVLCLTFLIFYAVVRGELKETLLGVSIYAACLTVGSKLFPNPDQIFAVITILYFAGWMIYGSVRKRFNESPILIGLVIAAFIFGSAIPGVGQRLNDRNEIFKHTWNNEVYGGDQVAQGIWALAGGGATGQGLGLGSPNEIPANHTDMILASIGEELGWLGLIVVFASIGILLHRTILIGRRNAHPFAFYLTGGIAVVTGAQFFIIASGSLGALPLTGVPVPFLSYGKISMIINLAAWGIVMSASTLKGKVVQQDFIKRNYDPIIALGCWSYCLALLRIIWFLFMCQVWHSNEWITKPVLAVNRSGERIYVYNPRINFLMRKLNAGNIYDRNGLLLATSDKNLVEKQKGSLISAGLQPENIDAQLQKRLLRYYPFEANMFFWTGDYNTRVLWTNDESGYFAENRYLSALRGFKTIDDDYKKILEPSHHYTENRFLPVHDTVIPLVKRNYSALAPLLKAGLNSKEVETHNKQSRDIWLTADARLQLNLQNALSSAPNAQKYRTSVVVLNGSSGEVLASALSVLPNADDLRELSNQDKDLQRATIADGVLHGRKIVERDLGATFATFPGSTAKLMTALAAFNKMGYGIKDTTRYVDHEERIHATEPADKYVSMELAITASSNVYFIKLANDFKLDEQMLDIYLSAGLSNVQASRRKLAGGYTFYNDINTDSLAKIKAEWQKTVFDASDRNRYNNLKLDPKDRLQSNFSRLAWGQGEFATPLAMARVVGAIGNKGIMRPTHIVLKNSSGEQIEPSKADKKLADDPRYAQEIANYMINQSQGYHFPVTIAGKTGTPEREDRKGKKENDAWYVFFGKQPGTQQSIVVCIRMERTDSYISTIAVLLARDKIIPTLQKLGYL